MNPIKLTKNKFKLFFVIIFFLFFCLNYVSAAGIVPDGGKKATGDYALEDFVVLMVNISNYILGISGSLALLAFIVGGAILLFSGGGSEMIDKGKRSITGAVIGLIIIFTSWTIINFSMKSMGYEGEWYTVAIPERKEVEKEPPTDLASIANDIKNNNNITLSNSADCAGFSAQTSINEIADTGQATACSPTCDCDTSVTVDSSMLSATQDVANQHSLVITSVTTGIHSATSGHYDGKKIDIVPVSQDSSDWDQVIQEYMNNGAVNAACDIGGTYYSCSQMFNDDGTRKSGAHIDVTYN
ncbi:MAG: pilin [Patescibacteria group bacterium]